MSSNRRPEDEEVTETHEPDQAYGLGRIMTISDAVFAFALTLLVVQLTVPSLSREQVPGQLASKLLEQYPLYLSYLLSFAVISIYWFGHHRIFKYIRRYDAWLIILNQAVLLLVAVMPFPTAVLGRYGDQPLAVVLYAATLGSTGLGLSAIWVYATHKDRLVSPGLNPQLVRLQLQRALTTPIVFGLSIPIALWRPTIAQLSWGLIRIVISVFERQYRIGLRKPGMGRR